MSDFLLSQLIVSVALVFDLSSVQMRQRQLLIAGQAIAGALISAHFYVLEIHTAAWMFALATCRLLVSLKWRAWPVQAFFYGLIIVFSVYSYSGYYSLISCIASLLMAAGSFAPTIARLRLLFITGSATWLVHNLLVWTPVGIVMEMLFLSSNLVGYYRFVIKETHV